MAMEDFSGAFGTGGNLHKYTPGAGAGTKTPSRTGSKSMPASSTSAAGRNITTLLTYPDNIESDPQQGHYIMFEIYKQDPSKLSSTKAVSSGAKLVKKMQSETGTPEPVEGATTTLVKETSKAGKAMGKAFMGTLAKHSGPNSLQEKRKATTKMDTAIALYMPPSVQVTYGANYNEQEIGVMAESGGAAIQAFMNTEGSTGTKIGAAAGTAAGGLTSGIANKVVQMMPAGGAAVLAIERGSIVTPRMELMFEGIPRRSFSFAFTFIPKSADEAVRVEQIVKKFKYHMASNYGSRGTGVNLGGVDGVREMTIPDFFQISYWFRGKENSHLNKIKKCVLSNAQIEYGADRYKAFENGQPQTTKLSLSFSELEIITKDYIQEGY